MKTNVSIKFNSIEEYREIESKLIELGYVNDKEWNYTYGLRIIGNPTYNERYVLIYNGFNFEIHNQSGKGDKWIKHFYNSLNDFLNDN